MSDPLAQGSSSRGFANHAFSSNFWKLGFLLWSSFQKSISKSKCDIFSDPEMRVLNTAWTGRSAGGHMRAFEYLILHTKSILLS